MSHFKPCTFITGGENGADSIPFTISREFDIKVEGWMPKGFKRSDGMGEKIAKEFTGMRESPHDSFALKDIKNAGMSDALIGFLTSKPKTGKGTMQTAGTFIRGWYRRKDKSWIPIKMPECEGGLYIKEFNPEKKESLKPVLLIWDLTEDNYQLLSHRVTSFIDKYKPERLMISGPTHSTSPDILELGIKLFRKVFTYDD